MIFWKIWVQYCELKCNTLSLNGSKIVNITKGHLNHRYIPNHYYLSIIIGRSTYIMFLVCKKHRFTLCLLGNFSHFCCLLILFQTNFFKIFFLNTISVANSYDLDQIKHFNKPDLAPNCLQRVGYQHKILIAKSYVLKDNIGKKSRHRSISTLFATLLST